MSSQAFLPSVPTLRDFGGEGRCSPPCQNDVLKVLKICERPSTGISVGSQTLRALKWERHGRRTQNSIVNALPSEAASAAAAFVIVGASAGALLWMNLDKIRAISPEKEKCGACDGSGLCSACKGEGFQLKDLSAEAVERARANARNAATRYTAGDTGRLFARVAV
ncbi:hypothetical protein L7F22_006487 [Adiantum nelumboides]|nr:hypothetical protein [Adiantum nelumboides]